MRDEFKEMSAEEEAAQAMFPYLAADELLQLEYAETPDALSDLMSRIEQRRTALDAFSFKRYCSMAWEHDRIEQLFQFLGIELGEVLETDEELDDCPPGTYPLSE